MFEKNSYIVIRDKPFFGRLSESDARKPRKPVKISVKRNPTRETTRISSSSTLKWQTEQNKKIAAASRVPNPANVIGIKPIILAIGYKRRK